MILNLSKHFQFSRRGEEYAIDYRFTKNSSVKDIVGEELCLTLNISINEYAKSAHVLLKPNSVLYQSNECIEDMIIEETLLLFSKVDSN